MAAGIHYPEEGAGQSDNDRSFTFQLKDDVAVYSGFAGNETSLDQRDWDQNITVLSGDLEGDDATDANGVITDTVNISGTNSYHVVTGSAVTVSAVLDGFTITGGSADSGSFPDWQGGGMDNYGDPTLINVTFSGNSAKWGGGMSNNNSNPTLTNVTFSTNTADDDGGRMYNDDGSPTLTNVTFSSNEA